MSTYSFQNYCEHFKDFLEDDQYQRKFVITEFDDEKNLVLLGIACVNDKELCAGHINLYNATARRLEIDVSDLVAFLNYACRKEIEIIYSPNYFENID